MTIGRGSGTGRGWKVSWSLARLLRKKARLGGEGEGGGRGSRRGRRRERRWYCTRSHGVKTSRDRAKDLSGWSKESESRPHRVSVVSSNVLPKGGRGSGRRERSPKFGPQMVTARLQQLHCGVLHLPYWDAGGPWWGDFTCQSTVSCLGKKSTTHERH
jgi:hypothetical protein